MADLKKEKEKSKGKERGHSARLVKVKSKIKKEKGGATFSRSCVKKSESLLLLKKIIF